jgi:hypothetical protein
MKKTPDSRVPDQSKVKLYICEVLSGAGVTIDAGLDWMIGFIAPYTFTHLGTAGITMLLLTHFPVHRYTRTRFLSLH